MGAGPVSSSAASARGGAAAGGGKAPGVPSAARRRAGAERLLVPAVVVHRAALAAAATALVFAPWYWSVSPWLGLAIAATVFVLVHGTIASYRAPWIPGVIAIGACLQWALAPWAIYALQRDQPVPMMAVPEAQYFAFAVPCTLALIFGMYLPLWRRRGASDPGALAASIPVPPGFSRVCDVMLVGALAVRILVLPFVPASLRYAAYLFSLLALVAVLCQMLLDVAGWRWRALVVMAVAAVGNAADLQFLEVLLVALSIGMTYYFRFRPRLRTLALVTIPAAIVFLALSAFKVQNRDRVRGLDLTQSERAAVTSLTVYQLVRQPSLLLSPAIVGASMNRLNEGWVTSRILAWVPAGEPYARGETIVTALRAAFVPRVLDPGKYVAGGAVIVPRFTGLTLINSTSIGLSVPGEMYANFGSDGAWIGTFVYGVLLGLLYVAFLDRARRSIVWLAWVPFVFFGALSVEPALGEVLNHLSKTLLLVWVTVMVVPQWKRLRRARRVPSSPLPARFAPHGGSA